MVQRPQRHQGLDATAVTPGRTVPPRLLMCYQYLVHRYMLCLPGVGGAFCVLQIQTHLFQLLVIALQIGFLKTPIAALQRWTCWLLLLRWQTFHNSSSQRYIFFISVLSLPLFFFFSFFKLPLAHACFTAAGSYHNRNHSSRGSASSSGLACCHNSPCEPRTDR